MISIITDSTCDLPEAELNALKIKRVPLYVHFNNEIYKDWEEITPKELVEGVRSGADIPSTSQPSPVDFKNAYDEVIANGASEILVITISSGLSGTFQSANVAAADLDFPISIFDSKSASLGIAGLLRKAAILRDQEVTMAEIISKLEKIRDSNHLCFTVENLDYLQKNGRIGGAAALVGGLLNIKPILGVVDGKVDKLGRARGEKKAFKEIVKNILQYREKHEGKMQLSFLHVQKPEAAQKLRDAIVKSGIEFEDMGDYEIGTVIASHVGPGVYGTYANIDPE